MQIVGYLMGRPKDKERGMALTSKYFTHINICMAIFPFSLFKMSIKFCLLVAKEYALKSGRLHDFDKFRLAQLLSPSWHNSYERMTLFSAGLEKTPMVRGEERGGRLVYQYEPRSTFVSGF